MARTIRAPRGTQFDLAKIGSIEAPYRMLQNIWTPRWPAIQPI